MTSETGLIFTPNQPLDAKYPPKEYAGTLRKFNPTFYKQYPWLHWDNAKEAVYCQPCFNVHKLGLRLLSSKKHGDEAFSSTGYHTWRTPTVDFKKHEKSAKHLECVQKWHQHVSGTDVHVQLSEAKRKEQQSNKRALLQIFKAVHFLARQGLSFRGHVESEGNFWQMVQLLSASDSDLHAFLESGNRRKFLSPDNQNEILRTFSQAVQREIISHVKGAKYFALIGDETTDVSRMQQMSICLRWVDSSFAVHEDFVGMYEVNRADSQQLSSILLDVLMRFGLSINNLRGQGYDGAAVMSGCNSGVAKRISELESRAVFVHCSGHSMNLAVQDAARNVHLIRDTIEFVKDVVNFVRASPLRMRVFEAIRHEIGASAEASSASSLRPLCPTRWTVRVASIQSVIDNYSAMLQAMTEVSNTSGDDSAAKGNGFLKRLESFEMYAGLRMSLVVLEQAEGCNTFLQSKKISVADAKNAAVKTAAIIGAMRNDEYFDSLYSMCERGALELDLDPPVLPRIRRLPRRLDDGAPAVSFASPKELFRKHFFELIDHATSAILQRFDQHGMKLACSIEDLLTRAATGTCFIVLKMHCFDNTAFGQLSLKY
jgi:hypothetical protein